MSGRLALALATAGGIGFLRPAPGTWATAATALAAWGWLATQPAHPRPLLAVAAALTALAGLAACPAAVRRLGRADPGQVVVDEVLGTLLGIAVLPERLLLHQPLTAIAAVAILFRVFDIAKPVPVASAEALPGAAGIMADDALAGLLAGGCAAALLH